MRHVPDEELHAYLDQALSRSQCVEIETHLAMCPRCQDRRDATAAIRDRTTALLNQLTPRALIVPPPYDALLARKGRIPLPVDWRRRARRAGLWAAGLVVAVGAGWMGRSAFDRPQIAPAPLALQSVLPETPPAPVGNPAADLQSTAAPIPIATAPQRPAAPRRGRERVLEAVVPAPAVQFAASGVARSEPVAAEAVPVARAVELSPFNRIWRQVEWEDALRIAGSTMPYIEGMPVIGVLLQPGARGERPTVIVAQQDASGDVIQSIEGPVENVSALLARQATPDVNSSALVRTPPDYVSGTGGSVSRTLRVLTVTGRLSLDSLNALARIVTIR